MFVCLFIWLFVYLFGCLFGCLFICLVVWLFGCLFVCNSDQRSASRMSVAAARWLFRWHLLSCNDSVLKRVNSAARPTFAELIDTLTVDSDYLTVLQQHTGPNIYIYIYIFLYITYILYIYYIKEILRLTHSRSLYSYRNPYLRR